MSWLCFIINLLLMSLSLVVSKEIVPSEKNNNVTEYLARKLRQTKIEIAKEYMKERDDSESVVTLSYDIKWKNLGSYQLKSERALTVSMFNKIFILENNRIMSVIVDESIIAGNNTILLEPQVALIPNERPVKFTKSIVWKSKLYLLVCHEDACYLYTGSNDSNLRHRQIMKQKPNDAIFFTRANRLYLVIAHNTDEFPVSSIIYHWTGTYMDIIHRITTVGTISSVTSFNYKSSTMIVFGENDIAQPDVGSEIYEFNENGIERIQYLSTNGPIIVNHYYQNGAIFLFIANEREASSVYWWDGNEFLHWLDLPDIVAPSMVNIIDFNGDTLFLVSYQDSVNLYKVTDSEYSRLNLFELKNNSEKVVDIGVWIDKKTSVPPTLVTLLLVTVDVSTNLYRIEPWELRIKKIVKNNAAAIQEAGDATEECLSKLQNHLENRTNVMEKLSRETWPMLLASVDDTTISNKMGESSTDDNESLIIPADAELIVRSGTIVKIDISSSLRDQNIDNFTADAAIVPSLLIEILSESRKILQTHGKNRLMGNIIIESDGIFQELNINAIESNNLNDKNVNFENLSTMISARKNQTFSNLQLNGRNIIVHELEIDSICGIPHDYWLHNENENFNDIFINKNLTDLIVNDDTIHVKTTSLSLENIRLDTIENVNLSNFFDNLLIPGEKQLIKGNILQRSINDIESSLDVVDIFIEGSINTISSSDLITRITEQNINGNVFFKTLLMKNIVATRINGIDITNGGSAMVSTKNHITGRVTVANLKILDQLTIDDSTKFPKFQRPVQIYDRVTVFGNVKTKNFVTESKTNFTLSSSSLIRQVDENSPIDINNKENERWNVDSIMNLYWTKSTKQILNSRIFFNHGLRIDKLRVNFLNKLETNADIMFTDSKEIDEKIWGQLEFKNFTINGSLIIEAINKDDNYSTTAITQKLYDDSIDDALFFNQALQIEQLGVQQLYIESFNGISIDDIMRKNIENSSLLDSKYVYSLDTDIIQKFDTITINDRLEVENIHFTIINGENNLDFLSFDENYQINYLKDEKLTFNGDVEMDLFDKVSSGKIVNELSTWMSNDNRDDIFSLTIDGDVLIEDNAQVDMINYKSTFTYLDELATEQLTVNSEDALIIDNLTVRHDLTLNFLRGSRLESLATSIVSKSQEQNFTDSRFNFFHIFADYLKVDRINDREIDNLIYVDSYDIKFHDDVSFGNLKITTEPDIRTKYLNNYPINELYEKLANISSWMIDDLIVQGNISWQTHQDSTINDEKLETIMGHALRWRNEENYEESSNYRQMIVNGESTITDINDKQENIIGRQLAGVSISKMKFFEDSTSALDETITSFPDGRISDDIDIRDIVTDSFLDDPLYRRETTETTGIFINSRKSFKKDVTTINLSLPENGEIDINGLNKWRIDDLNSSIVRIDSLMSSRTFTTPLPISARLNDVETFTDHENIDDTLDADTTMIFRHQVEATKIVIENKESSSLIIHGLPISGIVTGNKIVKSLDDLTDKYLPSGTYLKHLVVRNNAFVKSLDSIEFDEFANDRVSSSIIDSSSQLIDDPILIDGNIQFNGRVRVLDEASIDTINHVVTSNLVINDSPENEIILGNETHVYGDISINGKTQATLVAGINLREEYENAVLNNENAVIFGDITFQAEYIELTANRAFVNEIGLKNFIENRETAENEILREIERNESRLEDKIIRAWNASNNLPEIFYYLETENNLLISGISNIERVDVVKIQNSLILGMYGNEAPNYCGLKNDCPCRRRQYVAEITPNNKENCRGWKVEPIYHYRDNPRIFYHFHEANGAFAVSVATTTVSSSQFCSRSMSLNDSTSTMNEFTTISWMKRHQNETDAMLFGSGSNVTKDALTLYDGYLSDARVFTHNGLVYIVLAIYYDSIRSSHETNSLIYVLDLTTDVIKLAQSIPTSRASAVQVFKIPGKGPHVLFSSSAIVGATNVEQNGKFVNEDSTPAETLLYRLEFAHLTEKFRLLRSFSSGGNRHAKSVSRFNDEFLLLDDIATNSINVYRYDQKWDNFQFHQSIYHDSMAPIANIETLYTGEFRHSQVYVIVTTERDQFFIYECTLMGKFRLVTRKKVDGILTMVPFDVSNDRRRYMFIGTDVNSTIVRIVEQGSQH